MTKPLIRIHNVETDEIIDREMTNDEFTKYQAEQELEAQRQAEAEAKGVKVDLVFDLLMTLMPKVTVHSLYQIAYTKDTAAE